MMLAGVDTPVSAQKKLQPQQHIPSPPMLMDMMHLTFELIVHDIEWGSTA